MTLAVVWLKRDLRLSDHQPLLDAAASGLPVLLLYCFEPMLLADPHYSARHWRFVRESLQDIQQRVPLGSLYVIKQDVLHTPRADVDLARVNWFRAATELSNFKCVNDYPAARDTIFQECG